MVVEINKIKKLTKQLAGISLKKYNSLTDVKNDFDNICVEFIDLDFNDEELIEVLNRAAWYFNHLEKDDFKTTDLQKINESKAVISKYCKELNSILIKWKKLGDYN